MRVFVAGGTGTVGRRLVPQLVARGHTVVATTRTPRKLDDLRALGAEGVAVDGLDGGAVGSAVADARPDVIVHEMTALAGDPDIKHFDRWFATTNELRTKGTENLLAAAAATGVGRVVAQSYTGWTNVCSGAAIKTENDLLDPKPASAQRESMRAIATLERLVRTAPLDGLVLRYGALYGPGASEPLVELVRARRMPIVGSGRGVWSWVHVDDAAAATVAAVENGAPGIYNVVDDDPAPVAVWLPYLATTLGAKPPRRIPAWLGALAIGRAGVRWMTQSRGASNAKAKASLDWALRYPSWRDGFVGGLGDGAR